MYGYEKIILYYYLRTNKNNPQLTLLCVIKRRYKMLRHSGVRNVRICW